jgi:uncharacterized flavoprotein (TIGR03862 family)
MAAEELARAGHQVTVAEGKTSPARKFLMAGKSGLNITKDEALPQFMAAYDPPDWLAGMLADFGPDRVQDWCRGLGQTVFTGSSGRVFPVAMKASPLLRAWLARLEGLGVTLRTRWRWVGFQGDGFHFETPQGTVVENPDVTVLALGGASWARLGSDGAWAPILAARGVEITPFQPANMGFRVDWSPHMAPFFGQPIKGARLMAGGQAVRAEFVLSEKGIEGGAIYALSRVLRGGAGLSLNLMPDLSGAALKDRLASQRSGETLKNRLRKLGLAPASIALVLEFGRHLPPDQAVQALPIPLQGPRPMDEAISTAGGVARYSLTGDLELRALPGIFAAGEMLDWEAPTGGYLLTACLATGRHAGRAAARRLG